MQKLVLILIAGCCAQQPGKKPEGSPTIAVTECSSNGCSTKDHKLVLDANWRWIHNEKMKNCYTGNTWDTEGSCPDPKTCAENCILEGVNAGQYKNTYGVTAVPGGGVKLDFVTGSNVGSRLFLLEDDENYKLFNLKNREFALDVDSSTVQCGMNGAMYFVEMAANGGAQVLQARAQPKAPQDLHPSAQLQVPQPPVQRRQQQRAAQPAQQPSLAQVLVPPSGSSVEGFAARALRMDSVPSQNAHNAYQAKVFDEKSDFFASATATPPNVVPRLQRIAASALLPFFKESGGDLAKVTGVDLSDGMLRFARERPLDEELQLRSPESDAIKADFELALLMSKVDQVMANDAKPPVPTGLDTILATAIGTAAVVSWLCSGHNGLILILALCSGLWILLDSTKIYNAASSLYQRL
eukprot:Skav202586  [mRNA]  locus=scaffold1305:73866:83413:+ [translate_table: standard]